MRGILINPYERRISEVEVSGDLQSMYDALSEPHKHRVDCVCQVQVMPRPYIESLWLDDEGFLTPDRVVFFVNGEPLCGRGLILGTTEDGDNRSSALSVGAVASVVKWSDQVSTGDFTPTTESKGEGMFDFVINTGKPILKDKPDEKNP